MTRSISRLLLSLPALAGGLLFATAAEAIIIVDGYTWSVADTLGQKVHGGAVFGFNVKPAEFQDGAEGASALPFTLMMPDDGAAKHTYQAAFALQPPAGCAGDVTYDVPDGAPGGDGMFMFGAAAGAAPNCEFEVGMHVDVTQGAFDRLSWFSFNPQPEPPDGIGFEFDVETASPTEVVITFSMTHVDSENLVAFTAVTVPAPPALALLAVPLGLLLLRRARRT